MSCEDNDIKVSLISQLHGYDANAVLEQFMGTSSINPETEKFIDSIYELIEQGDYSLAEEKIEELSEITSDNHQDVIMARMELRRRMK